MKKEILFGAFGILVVSILGFVIASQIEMNISLDKGWNLIYGFGNPSQLSGGDEIGEENIKAIYGFNPIIQEYIRMYPNPENDKIDVIGDEYLEKTAMWVYSDVSVSTEYRAQEPLPLSELKLYAGWNFVAITPEMKGKTFNELKGNCDFTKVYHFESLVQEWSPNLVNDNSMDEELTDDSVGLGILIKVTSDCKLGTSGNSVGPPGLPGTSNNLPRGATTASCIDSDGGNNVNVKGILDLELDGQTAIIEESCVIDTNPSSTGFVWDEVADCSGDDCYVREGYCETFESSEDWWNEISCPNGCNDGACL
ncbi:MAG: hypothetical protein KKF56_02865 [Nanoarchaeota archaeon]|nr:hypothetical protein [Nanoarchaeota archaeon]